MSAKHGIWGTLAGIGAAVGLAVAHNIDAIIANPGLIASLVLSTVAGVIFGHGAGQKSAGA